VVYWKTYNWEEENEILDDIILGGLVDRTSKKEDGRGKDTAVPSKLIYLRAKICFYAFSKRPSEGAFL
jgi:hypothetical protein